MKYTRGRPLNVSLRTVPTLCFLLRKAHGQNSAIKRDFGEHKKPRPNLMAPVHFAGSGTLVTPSLTGMHGAPRWPLELDRRLDRLLLPEREVPTLHHAAPPMHHATLPYPVIPGHTPPYATLPGHTRSNPTRTPPVPHPYPTRTLPYPSLPRPTPPCAALPHPAPPYRTSYRHLVQVRVWLPPGYDESSPTRYPTLFVHDGQNMMRESKTWHLGVALSRLIAEGEIAKPIVVLCDSAGNEEKQCVCM